jgi:cytidylate kinase
LLDLRIFRKNPRNFVRTAFVFIRLIVHLPNTSNSTTNAFARIGCYLTDFVMSKARKKRLVPDKRRKASARVLQYQFDRRNPKNANLMPTPLDTFRGYIQAQTRLAAEQPRRELPVVTISRETGAGAITIAGLVAKQLNLRRAGKGFCPWTVFDRNLVERVLADHELPATIKQFVHEDAAVFDLRNVVEELLGLHPSDWTLVHHTTDTVLRLAQLGNVILVGRGSNIITANFKNAFHVRLVAPLDARIKHIAEYYQLTEKEAAVFVREKDRARRRYVKLNFHAAIDDPLQYHVTINTTGRMTFEDAARMIADAAELIGDRSRRSRSPMVPR